MGLFDFLKKKKKEEPAPEAEAGGVAELNTDMIADIEPPETRYTQEYQDFLASQEQQERSGAAPEEAPGEVPEEEEDEQGFE